MKQLSPEALGTYIGMGIVVGTLIWIIVILIKYKPVQIMARRWENIKNLIKQLVLMYSDKPSIFAKKRVESGIMFYWVISTLSCFIWYKRSSLVTTDILMLTTPILVAAGYAVKQIQDEKKMNREMGDEDKKGA